MDEISIIQSNHIPLSFLTGKDAYSLYNKGWGYSFVYSLQEVRDIYLAIQKYKYINLGQFTDEYVIPHIPNVGVAWNKRRVLEILNALVNFGLLTPQYELTNTVHLFEDYQIGKPIDDNDNKIFRRIFFSYHRFRDFSSLYLPIDNNYSNIEEVLLNNSMPLFSFGSERKYTDSFLKRSKIILIYIIYQNIIKIMRK